MAFPAARFTAAAGDTIGLRVPAELTRQPPPSLPAPGPGPFGSAADPAGQDAGNSGQDRAVGLDREVPPSGNLWVAGQQIWLGPAMTGRTVRIRAGLSQVHVLLGGHRIKTLPSRLDARDLARLSAGLPLAGQRVTLRLEGPVVHILAGGVLARTVACPVPPEARPRLRGARPGTAQPPRLPEPLAVTRRVSVRGAIMIGGQKIQVGLVHARKTVQVSVGPDTYQIEVEPGITVTAPRVGSREIRRHKASHYDRSADLEDR
jgi:hypothetical protein